MSRLLGSLLANPTVSRLVVQANSHPRWGRLARLFLAKPKEMERFAKFAVVGTFGAVVDFCLLNLLILAFHLSKFWANTFSFSAAVFSNFIWNRFWTFPESRRERFLPQLIQFALVGIGGYIINQTIFLGLDSLIFHIWGTLGYNIAKAIAILVVLFWNFGINRIWTYRKIK